MNSTITKNYLLTIDGLRGVAILMVLALHTFQHLYGNMLSQRTYAVLSSGAKSVQLLFMLSALSLFESSEKRFKEDKHHYLSFYLR